MLHSEFAIADTCFLIDWARYRRKDILFQIFHTVFIAENIMNEVKSERTISWISESLARDQMAIYTASNEEVEEAIELVHESRRYDHIPSLDLPEALCLVIGRRRKYIVLTENRGALLAPRFIKKYRDTIVWRSLEVLFNAVLKGYLPLDCNDILKYFREYSEDTLHIFPSRALNSIVERVQRICLQREK